MTIKEVIKNLLGMEVTEEFETDVICAFGSYEFENETEVIVTKDESNSNIDYQAYINHLEAPIICIEISDNKIIEVWEA